MPGLLQLLLNPSEQLRELQLALSTAAGVPANAQVCILHDSCVPGFLAWEYSSTRTLATFNCRLKGLHSTDMGISWVQ